MKRSKAGQLGPDHIKAYCAKLIHNVRVVAKIQSQPCALTPMVKRGEEVSVVLDRSNGLEDLCCTVGWCSNWCSENLEAVSSKEDSFAIHHRNADDGGLSACD